MGAFKALVGKLEKKGNSAESSKKIAGAVGIRKYGPAVMEAKSKAGRMKSDKNC